MAVQHQRQFTHQLTVWWLFGLVAGTAPPALAAKGFFVLEVEKSTLRATLSVRTPDSDSDSPLATFPVALGRVRGDKEREGDLKTPEGIYAINSRVSRAGLNPGKYGPLAIPLAFPNPWDQDRGISGSGIWLHGAGDDSRLAQERVTEGCVAFFNADIARLGGWLQPQRSLAVIHHGELPQDAAKTRAAVRAATTAWLSAWRARDHTRYLSFYHPRFRHAGRNRAQYGAYKRQVFGSYRQVEIDSALLFTFAHAKYAVSTFNQDFRGDRRFRSSGRKSLYWEQTTSGWQIVREDFSRLPLQVHTYEPTDFAALQPTPTAKPTPANG